MRRLAFLVLAISLVLCGCSDARRGEEMMTEFSERISLAGSITLEAEISADVGGKDFDFTVLYTKNAQEERVEILSPESIAGVAAVIGQDGASLHYEDLVLAIGSITQSGVSPMSALPLALGAIAEGSFLEVRKESDGETEMTAAEFFLSETQSVTLYLDADTMPKYITLSENGAVIAECEVLNISLE